MAKSKDDIRYGTAQAKVNEDDALRIAYVAGTPLEGGLIAKSEPIDLFSSAHNIEKAQAQEQAQAQTGPAQSQLDRDDDDKAHQGGAPNTTSSSRRLPKKSTIPGPSPPQ